ncbi:hypothetical protein EDM56_29730 [Brevibacillus fluminis]|uniref:Helicase XPB/Ssl2 N-terminal domain-containing protein n=1 Tax=Brevibacillus fluminis TaxID=511487 RepID=A0A3M8CUB0_9BACL|nr:hypothetical protein [Brevibacillus fluminis]RNB79218.1 hypothetical protein EDM56_29730 [Brevibacillus fluminis]
MRLQAGFSLLSEATKQSILAEQNQMVIQAKASNDPAEQLADPYFLSSLWERLSLKEKEAAMLFLQKAPQGFLKKRDWDQLTKAGSAAWLTALTRLRRLGMIVTVRKLWSEIGYIMPHEVRESLHRVVQADEENSLNDILTKSLSYYISAGRGIHLDMFALLAHIYNEELQLTKKGTIHARLLPKLTSLLSLQDIHTDRWLQSLLPDSKNHPPYAPQLAFLLDLGMRLGFLETDGSRLSIVRERTDSWLALSYAEQVDGLLQAVVDTYLPPEPWLAAVHFELSQEEKAGWNRVRELLERLRHSGYELPDDAMQQLCDRWLHPLLGMGYIQLGSDPEGDLYVKWNPIESHSAAAGWYMEPTGDLLIPSLVPLSLLWELSRYADLSFEGGLVKGTLSMGKIQSALAHGEQEGEILQFMQKHCFHPIPPSVQNQLDQWARGAKQIRLETVVCVRTADRRILAELMELPSLAPFITEPISDTAFLIQPKHAGELLRLLKEYGYQPTSGGVLAPAEPNDQIVAKSQLQSGLFDIRPSWHEYHIENVFPNYTEAIPQLAQIPKLWTQHYQSYHANTLRDLLQRARELELTILMETRDGELEGIVQNVQVENGYWWVTMLVGKKLHRYPIDAITRARILLPQL